MLAVHGHVEAVTDSTDHDKHQNQQSKDEPGRAAPHLVRRLRDAERIDESRSKNFEEMHNASLSGTAREGCSNPGMYPKHRMDIPVGACCAPPRSLD